ncbi:hypothetical protein RI367_007552 [Sorochytrium milnesiophthora]
MHTRSSLLLLMRLLLLALLCALARLTSATAAPPYSAYLATGDFDVFVAGPVQTNWPAIVAVLTSRQVDPDSYQYSWSVSPAPGLTPAPQPCTLNGLPAQSPCVGRAAEFELTQAGIYNVQCTVYPVGSSNAVKTLSSTINVTDSITGPVAYRREYRDIESSRWDQYVHAVNLLKTWGIWDAQVLVHAMTFRVHSLSTNDGNAANPRSVAHSSPTFLTWHRAYLRVFERLIQVVLADNTFALPYWDWTLDDPSVNNTYPPDHVNADFLNSFVSTPQSPSPLFTDRFVGPNGDPDRGYTVSSGPFCGNGAPTCSNNYTIPDSFGIGTQIVRQLGAQAQLPTRAQVMRTINISTFDTAPYGSSWTGEFANNGPLSFRGALEGWVEGPTGGMHNNVHRWMGGTMMNVQYSIEDPDLSLGIPGVVSTAQGLEIDGHMLYQPMSPWALTHQEVWPGLPNEYVYLKPKQALPVDLSSTSSNATANTSAAPKNPAPGKDNTPPAGDKNAQVRLESSVGTALILAVLATLLF